MDISSGTLNNGPQAPSHLFSRKAVMGPRARPLALEIEIILSTVVLLSEKLVCTDLCHQSSHGSSINNLKIIIGGQ